MKNFKISSASLRRYFFSLYRKSHLQKISKQMETSNQSRNITILKLAFKVGEKMLQLMTEFN